MRAVLEFQLPEEQDEFERAARATAHYLALIDLSSFLRSMCKYTDLSDEQSQAYEAVRAEFYAIINAHRLGDIP